MSQSHIYEYCTVLQDYMVQSGSMLWSVTNRFRVYYEGVPILSVTYMPDTTFQILDVSGKVHKDISGYLDEVFYVEEVTIRRRHNGVRAVQPT